MASRLLRGREFTERDAPESERVVMINQVFADRVFPDEDPLGKRIDCYGPRRIVGVIANVKNAGLAGETRPEVCATYRQWNFQSVFLTVRAASDPAALAPVVTEHVARLNPGQPLNYFRTMQGYLDRSTARPRFRSMLLGWFALVVMILAGVGIYGVVSYAVAQRTNEKGIRMALGAQRVDVLKLVVWQGFRLTLIGLLIGLAVSFALTRVLESPLFGITATGATTFLSVPLLFTFVAMVACLVPARRAMCLNPTQALRYE